MRGLLWTFVLIISTPNLGACQVQKIVISGQIAGNYPKKIHIFFEDNFKQKDSITADIKDGKFEFRCEAQLPVLAKLHLQGNSYISDFYIDQPSTMLFCRNQIRIRNKTDTMNLLDIDSVVGSGTELVRNRFEKLVQSAAINDSGIFRQKYLNALDSFITLHKSDKISAYLIVQTSGVLNYPEQKTLFSYLDTCVKRTYEGKLAEEFLMREAIGFQNRTAGGKPFRSIKLLDINGDSAEFRSLKAEYIIVVFWASWCGPCRAENPALNRVAQKYKSRGIKFIGVSFDKDVIRWKQAIKDDKLSWSQLVDTWGFEGELAAYYDISAIPEMFMLDSLQNFVGQKNLRISNLELEIEKALARTMKD